MTYICEACGGEFLSERPDDEALQECRDMFGSTQDVAILCVDCYSAMIKAMNG
jgi:hypothetical protein